MIKTGKIISYILEKKLKRYKKLYNTLQDYNKLNNLFYKCSKITHKFIMSPELRGEYLYLQMAIHIKLNNMEE